MSFLTKVMLEAERDSAMDLISHEAGFFRTSNARAWSGGRPETMAWCDFKRSRWRRRKRRRKRGTVSRRNTARVK